MRYTLIFNQLKLEIIVILTYLIIQCVLIIRFQLYLTTPITKQLLFHLVHLRI